MAHNKYYLLDLVQKIIKVFMLVKSLISKTRLKKIMTEN